MLPVPQITLEEWLREMSFTAWVHYDLDGPAHLDPTYTGTGIYYRSIYWSKIYQYRLRVPVPVQGFRGLFYTSWSDLIHGTIVPLVLRSNIDFHADLSWLFCMICQALIHEYRYVSSFDSSAILNSRIACMMIDWPDAVNHIKQSAITSPRQSFRPTLHFPSIIGGIM